MCLLLALATLGSLAQLAGPVPDPDTSMMEPQVAVRIEAARRAVLSAMESAHAWAELGRVLHAHALEEEAAASYRRAADLEPNELSHRYLLALALESSRPRDALEHATEASRRDPSFAPVHLLRGRLLEAAGETGAALAAFQEAVRAEPRSAAGHLGLGCLHLAGGRLELAVEHLERAAHTQPRVAAAQALLARGYRRLGDTERALVAAGRARELDGEVLVADPYYDAVREETVSSVGYEMRAQRAERRGESVRADVLYRELLSHRPEDPAVRYRYAAFLAREDRPAEAQAQLARVLELEPGHADALFARAASAARDRRAEEAASLLERLLAVEPAHADALHVLGQIRGEAGDLEAAVGLLQRALAVRPDSGRLHYDLAVALSRNESYAEAWRHASEARRLGFALPEGFESSLRARLP